MPDQVFLTRKTRGGGEPDDRPLPAPSCAAASRETGGHGRKLRGLAEILAPYRWRVLAMFTSLVLATAAALAPAPLAKVAIDQGIQKHDTGALDGRRRHLPALGDRLRRRHLRADLPRRLGRPARAAGPAAASCSPTCSRCRSASTAATSPGVVISRMTNDVEALDQLVEDGLATLIQCSLTLIGVVVILLVMDLHLALLTFLALPLLFLGALAFRIASAGAYRLTREKIASITGYLGETLSGIRVVRAFGQERRHIEYFAELNDENRAANMTDRPPQRRLLPGRRAAVGAGDRRDPRHRRDRGDQRAHLDRRGVRLHRRAEQLLRPDPAALPAVHHLPVGDGGARQDLRPARRAAGDRRRPRRGRAAADPRRAALRRRLVPLRQRGRRRLCPARRRPRRRARPDGRARRRDRRRQVDVRQARRPLL